MIKYLYANNYKSFVNFRIDFDQSNLLVGKNGSGKSNVFALIASLRDIIRGGGQNLSVLFPQLSLTRWMKSNIQTFELGVGNDKNQFVYKIEIEHDLEKSVNRIATEKVYNGDTIIYQMINGSAEVYDDERNVSKVLADSNTSGIAFVPKDNKHSLLEEFRKQIASIILCTPDPRKMSDVIQNDVYIPKIDFSDIASVYSGVVQLDPEIYRELAETYKEVSPGFIKARISVEPFNKHLTLDYKYKDVSCSYLFNELSDGERMLFALYILLYGFIGQGMSVLLDEPDNFLSLREIQPWCINVERILDKGGQCIMISHHPEIIDYMAETDGIWLTRLASGESKIIEKPNVGINEDLLTYSEMISRGLLDEIE